MTRRVRFATTPREVPERAALRCEAQGLAHAGSDTRAKIGDGTCSETLDLSDVGEALRRDVARVHAALEEAREILRARTSGPEMVTTRTNVASPRTRTEPGSGRRG